MSWNSIYMLRTVLIVIYIKYYKKDLLPTTVHSHSIEKLIRMASQSPFAGISAFGSLYTIDIFTSLL